ncbi:MAG TPA: EAL domain-containing protein [Acidimicrobiia bacterium]|nr:EAL domain-containing protein [Acidimicrobiia bacterium]
MSITSDPDPAPAYVAATATKPFDAIPDPVVIVDDGLRVVDANLAAVQFFGVARDEWIGEVPLALVHREDVALVLSSLEEVQKRSGVGTPIELRVRAADGTWRLVELVGRTMTTPDGPRTVNTLRDLTERRRWEVAADEPERFRRLVENAATIMMLSDSNGRIQSVSGAVTRQLGLDPSAVVGSWLVDFVATSQHERANAEIRAAREHQGTRVFELELRHRDGRAIPYQISVVNLLDDPVVSGLVISAHDISTRRDLEDRLEHLAAHDALTGLANRTRLIDHLRRSRIRAAADPERLLVCFLDLDRFKAINDLHGHDAGDRMLTHVARRLRNAVRPGDFVARFGGDEFVVVCEDLDPGSAEVLAHRLETVVGDPVNIDGLTLQVFASVGCVDGTVSEDPEELLAGADDAMYATKLRRRGEVRPHPLPIAERRELADLLRRVLDGDPRGGALRVHFQPFVRMPSAEPCGVEALVRWEHPEHGLMLPARFLPMAEEARLANQLGGWVLDASLAAIRRWDDAGIATGVVAVNVAPAQLFDPSLPAVVTGLLDRYDIDAGRLCLEMTESSLMERDEAGSTSLAATRLGALRAVGIRLAIDDFGTGYSSLVHVRDLPFDLLKIDRSFVAGVADGTIDAGICAAVVALAHGTGKRVVAKGVERADQHERLASLGVDGAQGYWYCRPGPAEDVEHLLRTPAPLARTGNG